LIAAASDALVALGFNDFTIRINHRQVLNGLLDQAGIPRDKHEDVLIAIDKLDKIGLEKVDLEIAARGVDYGARERLLRFLRTELIERAVPLTPEEAIESERDAFNRSMLGRLVEFIGAHESGASGVEDLRQILQLTRVTGVAQRIKIDPTLARGLAYYTGAIIEINIADLTGSLGGGGRYDNLVGMFLGRNVPACGFSLGLERIIVVMTEREMFPANVTRVSADILIGTLDEESQSTSLMVARELREFARVDVYPQPERKIGKLAEYAKTRGIRFMVIIGSQERETNQITLQDLELFQRETMGLQYVVNRIREKLNLTGRFEQ